ncbi:hypothetical protein KJ909_02465 [Patescibacteria group bacterium]|nr:hypothetical protein [Patescibacteria group bacterium]
MKGKVKIKTIIMVLIMFLVVVLGVLGVRTAKTYLGSAAGGAEPKGVKATANSDGRGAEISWTSDKESAGVVEYGTTPASLLLRAVEATAVSSHRVALSPLKPNVNYYFRIRVGDEVYDNEGIPYSFKTTVTEEVVPTVAPAVTLIPTLSATNTSCNRETDYNGDGVVNSLDFLDCSRDGGGQSVVPTTVQDECSGVDFDKNGVINSIDRIKCLQGQ